MTHREQAIELVKIACDPIYFARNYIQIKSDVTQEYEPFDPWPAQEQLIEAIDQNKFVALLKARQLGCTSCVLFYSVWVALVEPNSPIFLVSKRKEDTYKLIEKLKLTWQKLPDWLRARFDLVRDNASSLTFSNGSSYLTFASNKSAADGLTGRMGIVDECDLFPTLDKVLNGVGPAVAKGGQLILLSKANKDLPKSKFKTIFREGVAKRNDYKALFFPWWSRPDRDQDFYDSELRNSGSLDHTLENYPSSVEEALAPRQESKRIPLKWLEACCPPVDASGLRQWPAVLSAPVLTGVPGLRLFHAPEAGRSYVIGVDTASGKSQNPNLDDSAAVIMDRVHQQQVGILVGKVEPSVFAGHVAELARYYNGAGVLVERNGQYGGTAITYLKHQCPDVTLLRGPDGDWGFNTTHQSKIDLYNRVAESARCGGFTINDSQTFEQLASIEASTLEAPRGLRDDVAIATGFALHASDQPIPTFDIQFIETGPQSPARPESPGEGIVYMDALGEWSVSVPPRIPGKHKGRVNVGNYQTLESARHAHRFASTLLGQTSPHPVEVIPDGEQAAVERAVRKKLTVARQLP